MTDTFNFDAKSGNRAARRAARAIGNIGKRIGRTMARQEPFDPDAEDGDGDGTVQDGTIWERPPGVGIQDVEVQRSVARDTGDTTGEPMPPREEVIADVISEDSVVESKRGAVRPYDPTDRRNLQGRTPEEIAEIIVPSNNEDFIYQASAAIAGSPEDYESLPEYMAAFERAMQIVVQRQVYTSLPSIAIGEIYSEAFGRDAWDSDAIDNKQLYMQRLGGLFGFPGDSLTREQINNRIRLMKAGLNTADPRVSLRGQRESQDPDFSPEAVEMVRAAVAKALRDNPAFLDMVQRFGAPPIMVNHPRLSGSYAVRDSLGAEKNFPIGALVGVMTGIQGYYDRALPGITFDRGAFDRLGAVGDATGVSVSDPDVTETFGVAGLITHEYSHYMSHMIKMSFAQMLRRERKAGRISKDEERKMLNVLDAGFRGQNEEFIQFHRIYETAVGRGAFDINNPENDGFESLEEMMDSIKNLLSVFYTDSRGFDERAKTNVKDSRLRRDLVAKYRDSEIAIHMSDYSATLLEERWAETLSAAMLELANTRFPVFTNDFAIATIARALGMDTENNGVARISRIDKRSGATQDISNSRLSTIRLIPRAMRRGPDGRRLSRAMGLNRDERSTLRSARANIELKTDQRLYAFDEPITVSDFRSRSRAYSIGDHRFYDVDTPNGYAAGTQRTMTRGWLAARRFINPNRPNHTDMVRAVSSTQLGFFVDDMPTYGQETDEDMNMLRGFLTGNVSELPIVERSRVESAVLDATRISEAIQASERGKKNLYRETSIDPELMLNSIAKGDTFPLPITAFTDVKPSTDTPVVIKLLAGSKFIDAGENEFLTQGTYQVADITDDGNQIIVSLEHKETFDPRHDAMRPVDRFSDRPGAMRKRGSDERRYTRQEASLMEADLQRRRALHEADMERIQTTLFSKRESGTLTASDKVRSLINGFIEVDEAIPELPEEQRGEIVDEALTFVRRAVDRRLEKAQTAIESAYGESKPWANDSEAMRKMFDNSAETLAARKRVDTLIVDAIRDSGVDDDVDDISFEIEYTEAMLEKLLDDRLIYEFGGGFDYERAARISPKEIAIRVKLSDEDKKTVSEMLDGMRAVRRAFGDSGKVFELPDGRQMMVETASGKRGTGTLSPGGLMKISKGGRIRVYMDGSVLVKNKDEEWGSAETAAVFRRDLTPSGRSYGPGGGRVQMTVNHDIMDVYEKSEGIGNILNQHAFLWYQQVDVANIELAAMWDGPFVWPRMGFEPVDEDLESLEGFAFQNLRNWLDGKKSVIPDEAHALRVAAWINLRNNGDERADARMLANIIDFKSSRNKGFDYEAARESWRKAFESNFSDKRFRMRIEISDNDFDNDYKPSYIIVDEPQRFKRDLSVSGMRSETPQTYRYLDPEGVEPTTRDAISRLALVGREAEEGGTRSAQEMMVDQSGYSGTPQLIGVNDIQDLLSQEGIKVLTAFGDEREIRDWLTGDMRMGSIDAREFSNMYGRFVDAPGMIVDRFKTDDVLSDPLNERVGTMAFLRPDARIGDHKQVSDALNTVRSVLGPYVDNFEGNYTRANNFEEQRARRKSLVDEYGVVTGSILATIYEIEDAKYLNPKDEDEEDHNFMLDDARFALVNDTVRAAVALGYDVLVDSGDSYSDTIGSHVILNRSAIIAVDQPMSLGEMARAVDSNDVARAANSRFLGPTRSEKPGVVRDGATDWWKDEDGTLLTALSDENPSPISLTSNSMRSLEYARLVRQDFGVDTISRSLRSERSREAARRPVSGWGPDDGDWDNNVRGMAQDFRDLGTQIEELEREVSRLIDLNSEDPQIDVLQRQVDGLNQQRNAIADDFASMVATSNQVVKRASENEAAISALRAFLDSSDTVIPDSYRERVRGLLEDLTKAREADMANLDGTVGGTAFSRHALLSRLVDEDFDLRWELGRETDLFEPVLPDYISPRSVDIGAEVNEDVKELADEMQELLSRGFYDPDYDKWGRGYFRFTGDDDIRRRIAGVFDGATAKDRRAWAENNESFLNNQYNADYEESIIDANPTGVSIKPNGVPADTWRKVRASIERAKKTPYDGERQAAYEGAKRLLGRHRPDLANDDFVVGLRSMRQSGQPIRGVPTFMRSTRGSAPASPSRSKSSRSTARVADRMRAKGFEFTEQDLLDGDAVRWIRERGLRGMTAPAGISGIGREGDMTADGIAQRAPEEIRDTVRALLESLAEMAVEDGFNVQKIEGHVMPKVQAPIMREIVDMFADDLDIALIESIAAPTYEQIVRLIAHAMRREMQLNKMFGSSQVVDPKTREMVPSTNDFAFFMENPGIDAGDFVEFLDSRGNVVMRVSKKIIDITDVDDELEDAGRRLPATTTPAGLLAAIRINTSIEESSDSFNRIVYEIMGERMSLEPLGSRDSSLQKARTNSRKAAERAALIEFESTPAGRHMQELVKGRHEKHNRILDVAEKMADRHLQLWRDAGYTDDDIKTRFLEPLRNIHSGDIDGGRDLPFTSPVLDAEEGAKVADTALFSYLKMMTGGGVPQVTHSDSQNIAMHEFGHFGFGQAFTRHGEFAANMWQYGVFGDAFWETFANTQTAQSNFDIFTLKEKFGRTITRREYEAMDQRERMRKVLERKYVPWEQQDRDRFMSDIRDQIDLLEGMTDQEKFEINTLLDGGGNLFNIGTSAQTDTKVAEIIYNEFIPLPAHLFGWIRSRNIGETAGPSAGEPSEVTKQEFAQVLRLLRAMRGRTRFFGEESQDEMAVAERAQKLRERKAKMATRSIVAGVKQAIDKYPSLRTQFQSELEELGIK
jgi:hypothetical protein